MDEPRISHPFHQFAARQQRPLVGRFAFLMVRGWCIEPTRLTRAFQALALRAIGYADVRFGILPAQ
jgi:hypothetical protein